MDAPSEYRHQGGGKETGTSGLPASESNRSPRSSLPAQLQQLSDTAHRSVKRGLLGIRSKLSSKHPLEPDYPLAGLVESAAAAAKHRVSSALPRPVRRLGIWVGVADSENPDRVGFCAVLGARCRLGLRAVRCRRHGVESLLHKCTKGFKDALDC